MPPRLNLKPNAEIREALAVAREMPQFRFVVKELRDKYEPYHDGKLTYSPEEVDPSIATNSEIVILYLNNNLEYYEFLSKTSIYTGLQFIIATVALPTLHKTRARGT